MKRMLGLLMMMGLMVGVLSGCASWPLTPRMTFPIDEYAALATAGTGVVKGQAFRTTRGGDVKTGAGSKIHMEPVTTYSTQHYDFYTPGLYSSAQRTYHSPDKHKNILTPHDPRYLEYLNRVEWDRSINWIADSEGRFELENIPPGEYYIMTSVTWEALVEDKSYTTGKPLGTFSMQRQGGSILKRIQVRNGETTTILLTK